jgi:hypothetical protein
LCGSWQSSADHMQMHAVALGHGRPITRGSIGRTWKESTSWRALRPAVSERCSSGGGGVRYRCA